MNGSGRCSRKTKLGKSYLALGSDIRQACNWKPSTSFRTFIIGASRRARYTDVKRYPELVPGDTKNLTPRVVGETLAGSVAWSSPETTTATLLSGARAPLPQENR